MHEPPESKIVAALARWSKRSGAQLSEMTGLTSGSLYPALFKMERTGVIESEWDNTQYPRRRRYKLSKIDRGSNCKAAVKRPRVILDKSKLAAWAGVLLFCLSIWATAILVGVRMTPRAEPMVVVDVKN